MKNSFFYISFICACITSDAQEKKAYSLNDIIILAQAQSLQSNLAQTNKEISFYQYRIYKSDFNPQIVFYGNAPVFNKEFYPVRQPDGTLRFQPISQHNSNLGFSLKQQLSFTGGELSLNTNITRFDDFKNKTKQYNGTPIYLQISQPLFGYNYLKWGQKIEPLKLEESKRQYVQEMESIAQQAIQFYFDVLDAQSNIQIAQGNLENTQINYEVEKKRVNLGTTTEVKLLQLELQTLRSRQDIEKAKYDYEIAQVNLKTFIGIKGDEELIFLIPSKIPIYAVELPDAIKYAKLNRAEFIAFERRKREASAFVAQTKAAKQQITLVASYGFNNAANDLSRVYDNPNSQQRFSLGFNIPIVDWGRSKAKYNMARSLEKLVLVKNELEESAIYQEITSLVKNIKLLRSNIDLSQKTDTVAQRRFTITTTLYQVGKLSLTELSLAQSEKDNARRLYVTALRAYWNVHYLLRGVTLYDFENKVSLIFGNK